MHFISSDVADFFLEMRVTKGKVTDIMHHVLVCLE